VYPYGKYENPFAQSKAIVEESESPKLPRDRFSEDAVDFCAQWYNQIFIFLLSFVLFCSMTKDHTSRPVYAQLLQHPLLVKYRDVQVDVASWVLDSIEKFAAKISNRACGPLTPSASSDYVLSTGPCCSDPPTPVPVRQSKPVIAQLASILDAASS